MGQYSDAAAAGLINSENVSGFNLDAQAQALLPSPNQIRWVTYAGGVAALALVGAVLDGRDGFVIGAVGGVAGCLLLGVTWTPSP